MNSFVESSRARVFRSLTGALSGMTVIGAILAAFSVTAVSADQNSEELSPTIGKFRNTYYYLVVESLYEKEPIDTSILDMKGRVLARVSSKFKKAMDIEGSGKLMDGRVLNFSGLASDESGKRTIRYKVTANPHGDGVGTCALVPFHTIAVDPDKIPLGSLVKIQETVGMLLPDGTRHDGLWRAEDVGAAIKKDRIDLFVGEGNQGRVLDQQGIEHLQALTVSLVSPPAPDSCALQALEETEEDTEPAIEE